MITGEFDEEILSDLLNQGYQGQELFEKFKVIRRSIPEAMDKMLNAVIKESRGKTYTMEEVFGDE